MVTEFDAETPLWIGHQGPYTMRRLGQVIYDIGKRAEITPLESHRLRRTFATWSLRSGCDIETLRRLMEHSSLSVLQGYLALVPTDLKKAHTEHSPMRMIDLDDRRKRDAKAERDVKPGRNNFLSRRSRGH